MRNQKVIAVSVAAEKLEINKNEAAVRLKIPRGFTDRNILRCEETLKKALSCKYAYIRVPVKFISDGICDIGFGNVESRDLCGALKGCAEAYIMGATIGIGADRLISRLAVSSPAESFITDALASAAAETLCEFADLSLRGNGIKPIRFSPGYGDLPLSCQPDILDMLNAGYTLGITLNGSFLMTPMKSVTSVMGILSPESGE